MKKNNHLSLVVIVPTELEHIYSSSKSSSCGDQTFSCAVQNLIIALPDTMHKIPTEYTFKKCLKKMLFKQAYDL